MRQMDLPDNKLSEVRGLALVVKESMFYFYEKCMANCISKFLLQIFELLKAGWYRLYQIERQIQTLQLRKLPKVIWNGCQLVLS